MLSPNPIAKPGRSSAARFGFSADFAALPSAWLSAINGAGAGRYRAISDVPAQLASHIAAAPKHAIFTPPRSARAVLLINCFRIVLEK